MGVVLKGFMPEVTERLQQLPRLKLTGLQQDVNQVGTLPEGDYRIQFTTHSYVKNGDSPLRWLAFISTPCSSIMMLLL